MIRDDDALEQIRKSWEGVRILRSKLKASLFSSMTGIGGRFPFFAADAANNLPFLHACGILNDVLCALRDQGDFSCGRQTLGALLKASKNASVVVWRDYDQMRTIVRRRNGVAHRGVLVPRGECWQSIEDIEVQLVDWGILEST